MALVIRSPRYEGLLAPLASTDIEHTVNQRGSVVFMLAKDTAKAWEQLESELAHLYHAFQNAGLLIGLEEEFFSWPSHYNYHCEFPSRPKATKAMGNIRDVFMLVVAQLMYITPSKYSQHQVVQSYASMEIHHILLRRLPLSITHCSEHLSIQ